MGFTPRDVDAMSLEELICCVQSWMKANGNDSGGLTQNEYDELSAMLK